MSERFYSVPCRLVGQTLWLRAGMQDIRLFTSDFALVTTHVRAVQPGQRLTHPDHWPAENAVGLTTSRTTCQAQAEAVGPATAQVIAELLAARPVDCLRPALRILKLADHYTAPRLEAACVRGLAFSDASLPALKRILAEGLEQWPLPATPIPAADETLTYARSVEELTDTILGGAPWN